MSELDKMSSIDTTVTVNEMLLRSPATVAVFNAFGIDSCCGGDVSIDEAARRDGADPTALITALRAAIGDPAEDR